MNKNYLKSVLFNSEVKITKLITSGVLNRADKRSILKSVKLEIKKLKFLSDAERNQLWVFGTHLYRHSVASAGRETDGSKRAQKMYAVLRSDTQMLEHTKNELADSAEYRYKHQELVNLVSSDANRFFYCTVLADPAKDHAAYQGKIYYKKHAIYSKEEKEYIRRHKLISVEDITLEKPWLCTRRNCRHRFVPVPFESVLKGITEPKEMYVNISYADENYRMYRDRLKLMVTLKKEYEAAEVEVPEQLKVDMRKTRLLMKSWNSRRK